MPCGPQQGGYSVDGQAETRRSGTDRRGLRGRADGVRIRSQSRTRLVGSDRWKNGWWPKVSVADKCQRHQLRYYNVRFRVVMQSPERNRNRQQQQQRGNKNNRNRQKGAADNMRQSEGGLVDDHKEVSVCSRARKQTRRRSAA